MSLYEDWQALAETERTAKDKKEFWNAYFAKETEFYKTLLGDHETTYSGTLSELAQKFGQEEIKFVGFLDGINSSLKKELKLDSLKPTSKIALDIDFRKLYYNMMDCKAAWLYTLPEWDAILSQEEKKTIAREYRTSKMFIKTEKEIGPNDPCPCGSGKKHKKCCGRQ